MFRITGFVIALAGFLAVAVSQVEAKTDAVALVLGNGDYTQDALRNPLNDARAMTAVLESAGFDVITVTNADATGIRSALQNFRDRLASEGTGLVYLAGHGAEIAGRTYFLATDSNVDDTVSLRASAVALDEVLDTAAIGHRGFVLLDICRTDPFENAAIGKQPVSTSQIASVPSGTTIAFASGPAQPANDGAGEHGLFTQALLNALQSSPASLVDALREAREEVIRVTSGSQVPVVYTSSDSRHTEQEVVTLAPPRLASFEIAQLQPAPGRNRGILPKSSGAHDLEFWNAIKDSTNPADYEAYLESFPEGSFAPLARLRVRQFSKSDEATTETAGPDFEVEDMEAPYVVLANANIRALPTADSDKVGELAQGNPVTVTGHVVDANWYRVRFEDRIGYIFGDLIRSAIVSTEPRKPAKAAAAAATETASDTTAPKRNESIPTKAAQTASSTSSASEGSTDGGSTAATQMTVTARKIPETGSSAIAALPRGSDLKDCDFCPELVQIKPGSFTMGSISGTDHERPEIRVNIGKAFEIGKYEVTIAEWEACAADGGCSYNPKRKSGQTDRMPMRNLSWFDAMEYVTWLSTKTGRPYRLPSEAEWEYVARAGTSTRYWWGSEIGNGRVDCETCGSDWVRRNPPESGSFAPNPYGVHDTSGSVWEWTADCWTKSHDGAPRDGSVRSQADCRQRVLRGGSWRNEPDYLRSASRFNYDAHVRYLPHGFRVAVGPQ